MLSRYGEDSYPISRLILARADSLQISRTELVRRLGYHNPAKGHRVLTALLLTGRLTPFVAQHLSSALEVETSIIEDAMARTYAQHAEESRAQREAEERAYYASFHPYLRAETERRIPEPIHVAAIFNTALLRLVPVSSVVWEAEVTTRDSFVRTAIIDHYRRRHGHVPAFGRIIGYALILAPGVADCDLALPYDLDGNRAGPMRSVRRLGNVTLTLKGKTIPSSVFTGHASSDDRRGTIG
jgi:hypothetical protein